jgi:Icc-related predicted phosphoesterase
MKIQIFSDLHADVRWPAFLSIGADVDVVIAAGDICEGAEQAFAVLRTIVPKTVAIVMVLGNHEYYRRYVGDELAAARRLAKSYDIHLLENNSVEIGEIRFVGASFWTDYGVFGADRQAEVMAACRHGLNDHRLIGQSKQPWIRFRPDDALLMHQRSKNYIATELAKPAMASTTVVVTHHGPHPGSVHPRYQNDLLTGGFVSNCEELILAGRPTMWVHGHTHNCADHVVGATRVICNPHGYANENAAFNPCLVVEVGT